MKISKLILVTLLVSAYATITVVHINMAQPKPVAEATLDMIEIMTRAFDESEGGEGGQVAGKCWTATHFGNLWLTPCINYDSGILPQWQCGERGRYMKWGSEERNCRWKKDEPR